MSVVTPYIKNAKNIQKNLGKVSKQIIIDNKKEIIDVIQTAQLGIGLNSKGTRLSWSHNGQSGNGRYAPSTQEIANFSRDYSGEKSKPANEPYNFNWSGNTFRFMDLTIESETAYRIFTRGGKQELLESVYGEIFDLTEENNKWVNDNILIPNLKEYIFNNLFVL